MTDLSDADLLNAYAQARSADAFAELVRRHAGLVYATARRLTRSDADALDVAQNCFLELARKAPAVQASAAAWLHAAATFRATDVLRRRDARREHERQAATLRTAQAAQEPGWAELEPMIDHALAELPQELREPVVLHYLQGCSQTDVAVSLGVNQSTVSRRLERGIDALRDKLGGSLLAGALAAMLSEHALAPAAPAQVMLSLGKMAAAGPQGSSPASVPRILRPMGALGIITAAVAGAIVLTQQLVRPGPVPPAISSTQKAPMNTSIPVSAVKHQGNRVWIEGVPILSWGSSGETTYCGALAAALKVVGPGYDYATLMGDSGLAMRLRWWRANDGPGWDNSGPVGEMTPWTDQLSRSIGWKIRFITHLDGKTDMSQFRLDVVNSINAGKPVLVYGKTLDMGLVWGYTNDGDVLLVRDYYDADQETQIDIGNTRGLFAFLDQRGEPLSRKTAIREAVQAIARDWQSPPARDDMPRPDGAGSYHLGPDAYDTWINDLTSDVDLLAPADRASLFRADWWTFNVMADARAQAATYFKSSAAALTGESAQRMKRAASMSARVARLLGSAFASKNAFLGPWSGKGIEDWTPAVRAREAGLLRQARGMDACAIANAIQAVTGDQPLQTKPDPDFQAALNAIKRHDRVALKQILDRAPDLVTRRDNNSSPDVTLLHYACWYDDVAAIDELVDRHADMNALDGSHLVTPIEWAHFNNKPDAMAEMENRGARIDLRMAARFNRIDLVQRLLQIPGIDKNAVGTEDYEGSVCLAVLNNNPKILKLLLDAGADANAANAGLETPLHQAAAAGSLECARLLLEHHADINVVNLAGETPLTVAIDNGHHAVADLLRQHDSRE